MDLAPYPAVDPVWMAEINAWLERTEVEPMGDPEEQHYLRLLCDHVADGVFDEGGVSVAWESVPVSRRLHRGLLIWQSHWQYLEDIVFDIDHDQGRSYSEIEDWFPAALRECRAFGYRLACAIKLELPKWHIDYLDEDLQSVKLGRLVGDHSYEVTLQMATGEHPRPTEPQRWFKR